MKAEWDHMHTMNYLHIKINTYYLCTITGCLLPPEQPFFLMIIEKRALIFVAGFAF